MKYKIDASLEMNSFAASFNKTQEEKIPALIVEAYFI